MRRMVVAVGVAVGVLWLVDISVNDGRYGETLERAAMALVGR
jgi:hypothetical protein